MIWLVLLLLAAAALAPLAWVVLRARAAHGRQEAALALHRAQLTEIDRDLAEGRILPAEHGQAVLEVQRRLLTAAEEADPAPSRAARGPLLAVLILVPVGALSLYLISGAPGLPAAPLAARVAASEQRAREEGALIAQLRTRLAQLDPKTEQARQGYVLLGGVEQSRGHLAAAAEAWRTALAVRFDPTLAAEAAEAQARADGHVTEATADLFRRALEAAPQDAPWRGLAEARLAEARQH